MFRFQFVKPLSAQLFHYFKHLILFWHTSQLFLSINPSITVHFNSNFITFNQIHFTLLYFALLWSHSHACLFVLIFILFVTILLRTTIFVTRIQTQRSLRRLLFLTQLSSQHFHILVYDSFRIPDAYPTTSVLGDRQQLTAVVTKLQNGINRANSSNCPTLIYKAMNGQEVELKWSVVKQLCGCCSQWQKLEFEVALKRSSTLKDRIYAEVESKELRVSRLPSADWASL